MAKGAKSESHVGESIMVIEDHPDIQESLVQLLEFMGYAAVAARDGQEALELLGQMQLPSLILLDLSMPRMDGATFRAKQIADPVLEKVPVILISADAELSSKARALNVAAFVPKPVDVKLLILTIERALENARLHATAAARGDETRPHRR
jgi:CheY-like chemotaxis protein